MVSETLPRSDERIGKPRRALDQLYSFLGNSEIGSPQVLAIADYARISQITQRIESAKKPDPLDIARLAVISETIRTRHYGETGGAYSKSFSGAEPVLNAYAFAYSEPGDTWQSGIVPGATALLQDLDKTLGISSVRIAQYALS